MNFEAFRRFALDQSRAAAARWENRRDDEFAVLLAVDDYDDVHIIPVPPISLNQARGSLLWLSGALPDIVANRSLRMVAFRASAWTTDDARYDEQPADDPNRSELLMVHLAEKGRQEAWQARISRDPSGLPRLGEWKRYGTDEDEIAGNFPHYVGKALNNRGPTRGRTMPAANMVLGPWDVPPDFLPIASACEPLDDVESNTISTFFALYRPESPGSVIVSQAAVYDFTEGPTGFMKGAMSALLRKGASEVRGPALGTECHYFEGGLNGLYRCTAIWRYPSVVAEISIAAPPGRYTKREMHRYAGVQDKRVRAELESPGTPN